MLQIQIRIGPGPGNSLGYLKFVHPLRRLNLWSRIQLREQLRNFHIIVYAIDEAIDFEWDDRPFIESDEIEIPGNSPCRAFYTHRCKIRR